MSDIADVVRRVMERRLCDVRVMMPCRIVSYDADTQRADVQPIVQDMREEGTAYVTKALPVITSVPVQMPGGGGYRLTFPMAVGDDVTVVFSDVSLDTYLHQGGSNVEPLDPRRHHISDAVAWPGLHPFNATWTGAGVAGTSLGKDGGTQVVVKDGTIHLGADNQTEAAVLGTSYRNAEDAYFTALTNALVAVGTALNTAGVNTVLVGVAQVSAAGLAGAGTALIAAANAAKLAFDATKPQHLSNTVKLKP